MPKEKKHKHKSDKKRKSEKKKKDKKRKRSSSSSSDSSDDGGNKSSAAPPPSSSFADLYPVPKRRAGPISAGSIASLPTTASELQKRNERAERFLPSAADEALAAARRAAAPSTHASTAGGSLRGQSLMLEKSYTRLTTLPNAADVRPLEVLRQAFELVGRKWQAERDYHYACDMLKSIRQDLTVQHLTAADGARCAFATQVYETHAILALQSDDLGEFGACQAALIPLHAARLSARAAEFGAYRLLHAATLRGASLAAELYGILSSLRPDHATHPAVLQALRVGIAMQLDDHLSVLGELPSLRYHGACLLRPKLQRLRERALYCLCRAYAPTVPLSLLAKRLGWGDDTVECERFLRSVGTVPAAASGMPERMVDTRQALKTLNEREEERQREQQQQQAAGAGMGPSIPLDLLGGPAW